MTTIDKKSADILIKIRPGRPFDAVNLMRILTEAHSESSVYPPVDQLYGLNWVTQTLNEGRVFVADVSGRLVGSLALTQYHFPWSPQWYMHLEWLYVQKKFRKSGTFDALMKACHAHADEHQAPLLFDITAGGKDVYVKDRLIQRYGYEYMGGQFIRRGRQDGRQKENENNSNVHSAVVD